MGLRLLLAPVGAGKTEAVQRAIAEVKADDPFASVWVIRATARQEAAFRQRLIDHGGMQAAFNVEFFNFYSLYQRILALRGKPQRVLDDAARFGLLRALLRDLQWDHYGAIRAYPGFATHSARFIDELKQQRIDPDHLTAVANRLADPRLRDLARLYTAYQSALIARNLVDGEGQGWLALEAADDAPALLSGVDLLAVDGFDQFNPVQAALLTRLSESAKAAIITLTDVPGRADTFGRRFAAARRALETAASRPLAVTSLSLPDRGGQPNPIAQFAGRFGQRDADPLPADAGSAFAFLEAPDAAREAALIARHIKGRLLAGTRPDDILIAVRAWPSYGAALIDALRQIGIPAAAQRGEPLADNPAIAALFAVLDLADGGFRWRDLLDVLRSPYFRLDGIGAPETAALEAVCYRALIIDGRDRWLEALAAPSSSEDGADDDDEDAADMPSAPVDTAALRAALARFFDAVTPPPTGSPAAYIAWLERLIGTDGGDLDDVDAPPDDEPSAAGAGYSLHLLAGIRMDGSSPPPSVAPLISRDLAALDAFIGVLRGLLTADDLLRSLGFTPLAAGSTWASFRAALGSAVAAASVAHAPDRAGRVLITTVAEARGLPHAHIYIPGLSEGIFPAPVPADPMLLDSERQRLAAAGLPLPSTADRADDDGLFYELLALAGTSLTLSRPTVKGGEAHLPSPLWKEARRLCAAVPVTAQRVGTPPPLATVAVPAEAALALAGALRRGDASPASVDLHGWLAAQHGDLWERVRRARRIEAERAAVNRPPDRYSGQIEAPPLREWVAGRFGASYRWSASALNLLGDCGFRFFAARALRLTEFRPPDAGMDSLQRGSILHAILEHTYRAIASAGLTIAADHVAAALEQVRSAADRVLADAPRRFGFVPPPTWPSDAAALRGAAERFIRADFSAASPVFKPNDVRQTIPRQTHGVEIHFGGAGEPSVSVAMPEGAPIRLGGSIDRIDRYDTDGITHYRVIDYKSGTSTITARDLEGGRNFQMWVYLRAAAAALNLPVGDERLSGGFTSLANREQIGELDAALHDSSLRAGDDHVARYVSRVRAGTFPALPVKAVDGRCDAHCPFTALCRVAARAGGK